MMRRLTPAECLFSLHKGSYIRGLGGKVKAVYFHKCTAFCVYIILSLLKTNFLFPR